MSEITEQSKDLFSPSEQSIALISIHEIAFAEWMAKNYFPDTPFATYMKSAKAIYDLTEPYRQSNTPEQPTMPIPLSPAKSALFRYGLEFYLENPNPRTPSTNQLVKAMAHEVFPETYESRLAKLTVGQAEEAVSYGSEISSDMAERAKILGISYSVLAAIVTGELSDMPLAEARSFSFNNMHTHYQTLNGSVHGTKVMANVAVTSTLVDTEIRAVQDVTNFAAQSELPKPYMRTDTKTEQLMLVDEELVNLKAEGDVSELSATNNVAAHSERQGTVAYQRPTVPADIWPDQSSKQSAPHGVDDLANDPVGASIVTESEPASVPPPPQPFDRQKRIRSLQDDQPTTPLDLSAIRARSAQEAVHPEEVDEEASDDGANGFFNGEPIFQEPEYPKPRRGILGWRRQA